MGVPPDEQCGAESGGVRTDPSLTVVGQHPKDEEYHPPESQDQSTSWFVCDNPSRLRGMSEIVLYNSFRHLRSTEKSIDIEVQEGLEFQQEEEASVEDKNNTEVSGTPASLECFELNDVSAAEQKASGSVQVNVIEAKCRHQKIIESVLQLVPAQEHFERKLSKTWKQECITYDDLNRNVPCLSPYGDQSKNFANSGFVKVILQASRKKLNMALDIGGMTKPNINTDSCEVQGSLDENCSPPQDVIVTCTVKNHKGQQQQKVASLPSKSAKKGQSGKRKQQQGLKKETKHHPKKPRSSAARKKRKRRQRKARGAHRPRSRVRGASTVINCSGSFPPQTASPKEQGHSLCLQEQHQMTDGGFADEPNDADSSTPRQQHSSSSTKKGNSGGGNRHNKGARKLSHGTGNGVGGGTGEKDDDDELPPGGDGESHVDITAQRQKSESGERHLAGHLHSRVPLHREMPPEVLRDETRDQPPSGYNLKPPPPLNQLSASTDAGGFGGDADNSGAVMPSVPTRKRMHTLLYQGKDDSGFSSGQVQAQLVEPLKQLDILGIPRTKPTSIGCPESSRFHLMVTQSLGVIHRDSESATGDQSIATADSSFNPELQKLARPPLLHPRLPADSLDVATPYSSLEYFDRENQPQDNVLGSSCTPFVSTAGLHLDEQVNQLPQPQSTHEDGDVTSDPFEGLLDHQQYPVEECETPRVDSTEMVSGCATPFLPTGVVCSRCSTAMAEPANAPTALVHANFESRIMGILSSPDLWTFTPQSDMYVPSIEPLVNS